MTFAEFEAGLRRAKMQEEATWTVRCWAKNRWTELPCSETQRQFAQANEEWAEAHGEVNRMMGVAVDGNQARRPDVTVLN